MPIANSGHISLPVWLIRLAYKIGVNDMFHIIANELSDGSATYDVAFKDDYGVQVIVEPINYLVADELKTALNDILVRFLACGSDRETRALALAFSRFMVENKPKI